MGGGSFSGAQHTMLLRVLSVGRPATARSVARARSGSSRAVPGRQRSPPRPSSQSPSRPLRNLLGSGSWRSSGRGGSDVYPRLSRRCASSRSSAASSSGSSSDDSSAKSDDLSELIGEYARQPQTSASLETLMKTGRGEYLHKHYSRDETTDSDDDGGKVSEHSEGKEIYFPE